MGLVEDLGPAAPELRLDVEPAGGSSLNDGAVDRGKRRIRLLAPSPLVPARAKPGGGDVIAGRRNSPARSDALAFSSCPLSAILFPSS
jgi:hypothetical protein